MQRALVIGAAECVFDDLERLRGIVGAPLGDAFTILAVNDGMVAYTDPIDAVVTLHPDELEERQGRRREAGGDDDYDIWTPDKVHPDYQIDGFTSAGLALGVGRYLGSDRQVLAGCPMDNRGYAVEHMHHGSGPWKYWRTYQEAISAVTKRHKWIGETVRSMSGHTRDVLGPVTAAWLGLGGSDGV